jgi:membrane protein implicated in regulation of membrane protease activity
MEGFSFLATLTPWAWFGFAVALLIIELFVTNSGVLLWLAIAAALAGAVQLVLPGLPWYYQYIVFIVAALLYSVVGRKYLRRSRPRGKRSVLNRRAEQYIGQRFFLEEAIVNGRGSIRLNDSVWPVSGPDLPHGSAVRVVAADGIVLKVELDIENGKSQPK